MYCNHCGSHNEDGTKICTSCGLEIQRTEDAVIPHSQTVNTTASKVDISDIGNKVSAVTKVDKDKIKDKLNSMDKKKLTTYGIIAGSALAVVVAVVVIVSAFTSKVSLKNYIADEVSYTGINGYGSIDSEFDLVDWESLQNDIIKKKIKQSDYDNYYYLGSNDICDYISFECTSENNGNLSNGDTVEYTFTVNKDGIKENKMFAKKISGGEEQKFKFKVEGLPEGTAIDVFDAVECVTLDTTSNYNHTDIKLKDDYVKQYEVDGINVKTENGYIKVYGDNFQSFNVYVHTVSDNFDETSSTVKLGVNCDADQYKDYGIVFTQTESDVPLTVLSYIKDNKFNAEDLKNLNEREKNFAAEKFSDEKVTLTKAILFVDNKTPDSHLAYFYKNAEGKFYVVYFDYIKITNKGRIYNIDDLKLAVEGWLGFKAYDSIEDYKQSIVFDKAYDVAI